jgi:hypothetical protein
MVGIHIPKYTKSITSMPEYEKLVDQGFEVKHVFYEYPPGVIILQMMKGDEEIIAEANSIWDYLSHLKPLYDFEKKRNSFVYVSDVEVYTDFEMALPMLIPGTEPHPILTNSIKTQLPGKTYTELLNWTKQISDTRYGVLPSEVFSFVCVIQERNEFVQKKTYGKELLSDEQISNLHKEALLYDSSIAVSYFMLKEDVISPVKARDVIIGIIVYNLRARKALAFNLKSITSFVREYDINKSRGFYDIVYSLFTSCVDENLQFKSYLPLPIDTPWYTVLPWICYLALLPIQNDSAHSNGLSIPEFYIWIYFASQVQ